MSVIITVEDLNTYAGKSLDDGMASQAVNSINQYVESITHRCWGETKQVEDERYDYAQDLWLRKMDIVSVDSVTLGIPGQIQSTLDPTSWFFNRLGRITLRGYGGALMSNYSTDYVGVSYTYGVEEVPDDLILAALGIALGTYNYADAGGHDIVATSIDSYRVQYAGSVRGTPGGSSSTPSNQNELNFSIIKSYAKPRS